MQICYQIWKKTTQQRNEEKQNSHIKKSYQQNKRPDKRESHVLFLLSTCSTFLRLVNTVILFRGTKILSLFGIVFYLLNKYCHCYFPTTTLRRLNGKPIFIARGGHSTCLQEARLLFLGVPFWRSQKNLKSCCRKKWFSIESWCRKKSISTQIYWKSMEISRFDGHFQHSRDRKL